MAPLLEVAGLTVRRGRSVVVDRVDLTVEPGAVHAVIGPNGGGKTSMVRALLGDLAFDGRIAMHWRASGRIGYVPQHLDLDRALPMTVADFLVLSSGRRPVWLGARRIARRAYGAVLEELGVDGLEDRWLADLSGGERRRVLLAAALVPEPELLVLDEPTTGVDRAALEALESALARRRDAGASVLVVSHDLDLVRRLADRVSCLARSILFEGAPAEVLTLERLFESFRPVAAVGA